MLVRSRTKLTIWVAYMQAPGMHKPHEHHKAVAKTAMTRQHKSCCWIAMSKPPVKNMTVETYILGYNFKRHTFSLLSPVSSQ